MCGIAGLISFKNSSRLSPSRIKTTLKMMSTRGPDFQKHVELKINNDLKFQLSEITRERIFKFTNQEVPYSTKIKTSFETYKNLVKVNQIILVKKNSQKVGKITQWKK